jgi:hypothetical protein
MLDKRGKCVCVSYGVNGRCHGNSVVPSEYSEEALVENGTIGRTAETPAGLPAKASSSVELPNIRNNHLSFIDGDALSYVVFGGGKTRCYVGICQ